MEFTPFTVAVWNKSDLAPERPLPRLPCPAVRISVTENRGIDRLLETFSRLVYGEGENARIPEVAVNARTAALLKECSSALEQAEKQFTAEEFELAASDLRTALHAAGRITGKTADPDILEEIFRSFCIGK